MGASPHIFERLVAGAIALAMQIVMGILTAPLVAFRRMFAPPRVVRAAPRRWEVMWGGEVVGEALVIDEPPSGAETPARRLDRLHLDHAARGRGLGRKLVEAVVKDVGEPLWCEAPPEVIDFMERVGWQILGEADDASHDRAPVRMVIGVRRLTDETHTP